MTNNEHISLLPYCQQPKDVWTMEILLCEYQPKETCFERSTGDARNKNKFNIIIPFLPTAKQAIADSLQTGLQEVELRFIFRCMQLYDSPGGNKCVDLPICYINYRHCSAQLLLRPSCIEENGLKSVQVHIQSCAVKSSQAHILKQSHL